MAAALEDHPPSPPRYHYAWVVAGLTALVLLVVAGVRSAVGVIILPLESDQHWSIAQISIAVAINVALYGVMGPFAAAMMQRFGVRRSILVALGIMAVSTFATSQITSPLQLWLTWGLGVGLGVGTVSMVLASVVATRWFVARRGFVQGTIAGATSMGQLIFLPLLAYVATTYGWRPVGIVVAVCALLVAIPIALFMRDRPEDIGLRPLGAPPELEAVPATAVGNPLANAFTVLGRGLRSRDFCLVAGTFFVCGASTNGFIGTHFIPACGDHGIPEVKAAGLLATMGVFSLIGTMLSGWLSDRFKSGILLSLFYGSRGLSLFALPYVLDAGGQVLLPFFMLFYGLDWLATGPPNLRALTEALGRQDAPIAFGWVGVSHALGSSMVALVAGTLRTGTGSYSAAFVFSAILCIGAAIFSLGIGGGRRRKEPAGELTGGFAAAARAGA